ncbi:photosystem I reaction center subunit N, chloroplastic-like [Ipomoea triloba]|uniref:photosystem I reaction center subunit N, chloroplastic-like n=1 Tax=Ipomoea triloba TaxID=35885 RepID=UPI00125D56E4|nr:photosystem I reaction center subunit N, chloroplastic-like [Ipomoea triloba]
MAATNSSVLACSYAISGAASSEFISKHASMAATPISTTSSKLPAAIKCQKQEVRSAETANGINGRRAALLGLAAALFATAASSSSSANAGVIDDYLEKSKANKELNDKKRLATSGANFARAYTVQFGTCKFPENFTGCQDLAKQKKVPFISDDLELECEGKDKYKCGSNVFWKW